MALWIGNVHLPAKDFQLVVEAAPQGGRSEVWIRFSAGVNGKWNVAAQAWDERKRPFLREPVSLDRQTHTVEGGMALVRLTPLPPGLKRAASAPNTGGHDYQLEVRAFSAEGILVLDIRPDRIGVPFGMALRQFGPTFPPASTPVRP